eukprot:Nk52_evm3s345 gene=Nk52_evmTU3s345
MEGSHPFEKFVREVEVQGESFKYFDVKSIDETEYKKLPYCIRILLESLVRNCNHLEVKRKDVDALLHWCDKGDEVVRVPFFPSRVVFQDFTSIPTLLDLAIMREVAAGYGVNPETVQPACSIDLLIDRCLQPLPEKGVFSNKNEEIEFFRCQERLTFIKWAQENFADIGVVSPGSGVVHQLNMQYIARVVFNRNGFLFPDSLLGTDSHSTMLNGMGVLGWGTGGMTTEAIVFGKPAVIDIPDVIGYKIVGKLDMLATSTDCVLAITKNLAKRGVKNKFVEFFGEGVNELSIADRITIANMCPEYGAIVGFFPVDEKCISFLKSTGRDIKSVECSKAALEKLGLFRDYSNDGPQPQYSQVLELDLGSIVPSCSGPKRPIDRIPASAMKESFKQALIESVNEQGYGITTEEAEKSVDVNFGSKSYPLEHGSVVVASINSCTNTSNPSVMLTAGLLAKKAVECGLTVNPSVTTSMLPGSGAVTYYLKESNVIPYLEELGFAIEETDVSGTAGVPPKQEVAHVIKDNSIVACGVLSGNRNFENRIDSRVKANYLSSPPLVIAYAIAGSIKTDLHNDPIGVDMCGKDVFLKDVWPSREEIFDVEMTKILPVIFSETGERIAAGGQRWNKLLPPMGSFYPWSPMSTYIQPPPFFTSFTQRPAPLVSISNAKVLVYLGDNVTTDHISPAGSIARLSPAARYLSACNLVPREFNSYGARRGNFQLMACGTFANIRLQNLLVRKMGPKTLHVPSGKIMDIYTCSQMYIAEGTPSIVLAGKNFGCGSSRDWAAKGPWLQGIKAVIAESFDPSYRAALIDVGILPLTFMSGESAQYLKLTGKESYTIEIPHFIHSNQILRVSLSDWRVFQVRVCLFSEMECTYYRHGGVHHYSLRNVLQNAGV